MRIYDRPDLPRHRYTGSDPDNRPVWGPSETGQADALLRGLIRQCFPRVFVRKLLIATESEQSLEACMEFEVSVMQSHSVAPGALRHREKLFARLALHLLRPADYQRDRGTCYIHRHAWNIEENTAHEEIEILAAVNDAVHKSGPEARLMYRSLLSAANNK
jgi:hypothetical protein